MKKIVKSHIEKHYCDMCGKLLFDYIPNPKKDSSCFGITIHHMDIKKYCDHTDCGFGYNYKEYCTDCALKIK